MTSISIATEDALSEAVAKKLVAHSAPNMKVELTFRKGGYGYLRNNLRKFYEMASRVPVLLLTDLDAASCPLELIQNWTGGRSVPPGLIFRVCVREIESWLLADSAGFSSLIGRNIGGALDRPDELPDPKRTLLNLAKRAPRDVRNDLLVASGTMASQGVGYNSRLIDFVENIWNIHAATHRSPSLRRAGDRIQELGAINSARR